MRIVIGLGGKVLLAHGGRADGAIARRHIRAVARLLAPLAAEHQLLLCHGSGTPSRRRTGQHAPYPLVVRNAMAQALVGYWLVQELRRAGVADPIAAIVTQALVEPLDPGGQGVRVVLPLRLLEMPRIAVLVDASVLVVCGGVPVCAASQHGGGGFDRLDACVDCDHIAALLAIELQADRLLLLTDVAEVSRDYGHAGATPLRWASVAELSALPLAGRSMAPKVEAACRFVRATDRPAIIGAFTDAGRVVNGFAGTVVTAY